jgi:hypothetical protein
MPRWNNCAPGELTWEYEVHGPYEFRIIISRVAISATPQPETIAIIDRGLTEMKLRLQDNSLRLRLTP